MKLWYRATAQAEMTFTPNSGASNPVTIHQEVWFELEADNIVAATDKAQKIIESFDEDLSLVEVTELKLDEEVVEEE